MDYYSAFRRPAYNSSSNNDEVMGCFDPMNSVVELRCDISSALDGSDGTAGSSVEPAGSDVLKSFATYLHETIHWWQHIGTTSGMQYALTIPSQALTTIQYLMDAGSSATKPIIRTLPDAVSRDDPALLAVQRWAEAEFGAAILFSPRTANAVLQKYPAHYVSSGESVVRLMISNIWSVSRVFDPSFQSLQDPREWFPLIDRLVSDEADCFGRYEIVEIPLGMVDVLEGQARFSELQYLHRAYERRTWAEIKESGEVEGVYATAFEYFLQNCEFPEPLGPCDPAVNLFLVICDIALNPDAGFPSAFRGDDGIMLRLHPGIRFMKLCHAVTNCGELLDGLESLSLAAYTHVTEQVCRRLGWPTPVQVAENALNVIRSMSHYSKIESARLTGTFGAKDVPIAFYFVQHEKFLETKSGAPHFFCWPGIFLTAEEGVDTAAIQELLSEHMPPFQSSSFGKGVDTVNLQLDVESKRTFVSDYFATQVLYDLVRQWISKKDQFSFDYSWKGELAKDDLETLKQRFHATIGFGIEEIAVAH